MLHQSSAFVCMCYFRLNDKDQRIYVGDIIFEASLALPGRHGREPHRMKGVQLHYLARSENRLALFRNAGCPTKILEELPHNADLLSCYSVSYFREHPAFVLFNHDVVTALCYVLKAVMNTCSDCFASCCSSDATNNRCFLSLPPCKITQRQLQPY